MKAYGTAGHEMSFPQRMGYLIELVGGAQKAAELLGRGWTTVDNWRKGTSRVPLLDALELARAAGVTLDWVATGYDRRPELPPAAGTSRSGFGVVHLYQAAPDGRLIEITDNAADMIAIRSEWLDKMGIQEQDAALISVPDDAMAPLVNPGDLILLDKGEKQVSGGGIYAFLRGGVPMIRRAQVMVDGAVQLIPENAAYDRERVAAEQAAALPVAGRARVLLRVL